MRKIVAGATGAAVGLTAALLAVTPASAAPSLRFHGAQYDSPGSDTRSNASLNNEWISLVNTGNKAVNLKGYTIRDTSNHVFTFGSVSIAAKGGQIWLHTGKGTQKGTNVYWGSGNYVWNNTGDTAELRKPTGGEVDSCTWNFKKNRTWVSC